MATFGDLQLAGGDRSDDSSDDPDDAEYVPPDEASASASASEDSVVDATEESRSGAGTKKVRRKRQPPQLTKGGRVRRGGIRLEGEGETATPDGATARPEGEAATASGGDEPERHRSDALWASFLSDVGRPPAVTTATVAKAAVATATAARPQEGQPPRTKIFDFAGESVTVAVADSPSTSSKRAAPVGGSGVGGLLDRLTAKRPKLSTLEKSRLDWEAFKSAEGIGADLAAHNRGRSGYLERRAFLERADFRRFELERDARLASSSSASSSAGDRKA